MKNRKFLALFPAVGVITLGVFLAGCGAAAGGAAPASSDAQQQFLADRGSPGTPGVVTNTTGVNNQTGSADPSSRVFGSVDRVEGDKVYISNLTSGQTTTVQLASGGKIFKQTTVTASSIKVGDAIFAVGTKNGTALSANSVQVGDAGMLADLSAGGFRGAGGFGDTGRSGQFPQGTPGAAHTPVAGGAQGTPEASGTPHASGTAGPRNRGAGGGNRGFGTPATGTVEKIDGQTITVKPATAGDPTTINLTPTTRIRRQAAIALSDLQAGNSVTASGTQNGDVFQATRLQVTEAPPIQAAPTQAVVPVPKP